MRVLCSQYWSFRFSHDCWCLGWKSVFIHFILYMIYLMLQTMQCLRCPNDRFLDNFSSSVWALWDSVTSFFSVWSFSSVMRHRPAPGDRRLSSCSSPYSAVCKSQSPLLMAAQCGGGHMTGALRSLLWFLRLFYFSRSPDTTLPLPVFSTDLCCDIVCSF